MSTLDLRRPLGPESVLSFAEVCRELGMGTASVQEFMDRHRIRPLRFGPGPRQRRYRWGDVIEAAPREGEPDRARGVEPRAHRTSGRGRVPL